MEIPRVYQIRPPLRRTNNHADRQSNERSSPTRRQRPCRVKAELNDAAEPPQLPAPRSQNSTATAAIRRLSVAFGGEHDQAAAAAGPPPAVDSRLGQRPGNERRSQRESENQQSTTAAHTSLSVQ